MPERKRLATLARVARSIATHPIEIIVLTFIFVTLAYFQLLQAVKESDFLNAPDAAALPSHPGNTPLQAFQRTESGEWVSLASVDHVPAGSQEIFVKQVQVLSSDYTSASSRPLSSKNVARPLHLDSVVALDQHLRASPQDNSFEDHLCFHTPKGPCFVASALSDADESAARGVARSGESTSLFYGLAKDHATWPPVDALSWTDEASDVAFAPLDPRLSSVRASNDNAQHASDAPRATSAAAASATSGAGLGITLPLSPQQGSSVAADELASWQYHASRSAIRETAGIKWAFYALRASAIRFYTLARKADSADIAVMLVAYFLMYLTFVSLYLNMRKLGSRFWLASSVLVSSVFGFICTLFAAYLLNLTVNPVTLSEALPFLVVVIGFEKPFILARAVFSNPAAVSTYEPAKSAAEDRRMLSSLSFITEEGTALTHTRESKPAQDIVAEAVQASGPRIVRDYAIEIVVLLVGALTRVHGLTEFCQLGALILAVDCASLFTLYVAFLTVILEVRRIRSMRNVRRTASSTDLADILDDNSTPGVPAENLSLKQTFVNLLTGASPGDKNAQNSTSRVKLLLVAAFIGLHVLNLVTPLSSHLRLHGSASVSAAPMSAGVAAMLRQFSALYPNSTPLVAHVAAPITLQMTPASLSGEDWTQVASSFSSASPLGLLDHVFTAWTHLTSDPVMSKWISLALGISVFLNGYLLKGIALGSSRVEAAESAARILLAATGQLPPEESKPGKLLRRHSVGTHVLSNMRPQYAQAFPEAPIAEEPRSRTSSQSSATKAEQVRSEARSAAAQPRLSSANVATVIEKESSTSTSTVQPPATVSSTTTSSVVSDNGASTPATTAFDSEESALHTTKPRPYEDCVRLFDDGQTILLSDEEIIVLVQRGKVAAYSLEKLLKDHQRAVRVRRALISRASLTKNLETSSLPYMHYDYSKVMGQCCENVIGYIPVPIGIAGPLNVDGLSLPIPMATTEGALIASTSRGCKALNAGGGVTTVLHHDAMTRGPAIEFTSLREAAEAKLWIEGGDGDAIMKAAFNSTSRFARLQRLKCALAGRTLFIRFATQTGDAMGMNMISKGTEKALETMMGFFPGMRIVSLSGNYCTDKKPAAINWIEGRGKSVVAECVIPGAIVKSILKTTVQDISKLNVTKNLVGSAMAGSVGGFNAHASNILTAVFLATGQDPAQNVESSQCMTLLEPTNDGQDLLMTCSMPSIEVGTIGGGTILGPQRAMLDMLGIAGPHPEKPGQNAQTLARIICASVMAGELSLMSALASGHLVKSHLALNRSAPATPATQKFTGHVGFTPAPTRPATPGPTHLKNPGFAFTSAE